MYLLKMHLKLAVHHNKLVMDAVLKLASLTDAVIKLTVEEEMKLLDALAKEVFGNDTF